MSRNEQELKQFWQRVGLDKTLTSVEPVQTIVPPRVSSVDRPSLSQLPTVAVADESAGPPELQFGDVLGEGGMGVVRMALQVPLDRQVAVKTLRPERQNADSIVDLLQEAWLTGGLEHPNIVPVYTLGRSSDGLPVLVMKKIQGTAWIDYLQQRVPLDPRAGDTTDALEWHLRILLQVCRALKFAHSKGIIHRDLKPHNVMLGRFGEVYLIDWGVAVSLRESDAGRIPLARDVVTVGGTPSYMAPEMAGAEADRLSEATDVYLLGAVLHEILTGEPPHTGVTTYEVLVAAYRSKPRTYSASVPVELACICTRAMTRSISARYPTVEAFEEALQECLRHRAAGQLIGQGLESLETLRAVLADQQLEAGPRQRQIQHLFGECRFAFKQGLKHWPESEHANQGLERLLELMLQHSLERREAGSARSYLEQMAQPSAELLERVDQLERQQQQRDAELAQMKRDLDPAIGLRSRFLLEVCFGTLWFVLWGGAAVLRRTRLYEVTPLTMMIISVIVFGLVPLIYVLLPASYRRVETRVARQYNHVLMMAMGVAVLVTMLSALVSFSMQQTVIMLLLLAGVIACQMALTLDPNMLPGGIALLFVALVAALVPDWSLELVALSEPFVIAIIAITWKLSGKKEPDEASTSG